MSFKMFFFLCMFSALNLFAMTNEEFAFWWKSYRSHQEVPSELKNMEDWFVNSGLLKYSSNYWNSLNEKNIEQICQYGYKNFKQTITRNYFTFVVETNHPYAANLWKLTPQIKVRLPKKEITKIHQLFTKSESFKYNKITEVFLNYLLNIGAGPLIDKLEEPLIGNPPYLIYNNKRISQDVFNSLLEYLPISKNCPLNEISTIIEVGAGSGRTAFCFITLLPNVKYIIVDFPPALYVSQTYLTEIFPNKKVMHFSPFDNFNDIAQKFYESDIIFLTPDQLLKLPNNCADLFLAIDCLHEMKKEMVAKYFDEAERLSSYIYFKCWQNTTVPLDNISYSSKSYPVHSNWQLLFEEPCIVPSDFFHAFYFIPKE